MTIDMRKTGSYMQSLRKQAGLTQSEMGERLNVTCQSVSNWERGEALPDAGLLMDIACMLGTTTDAILTGGEGLPLYRRRVSVCQMREGICCIRRMRELFGGDHFMYRAMVDGLDARMNSNVEPAFADETVFDAYVCEAILECVKQGDHVDLTDIQKNIASEKPKAYTIDMLRKMGVK